MINRLEEVLDHPLHQLNDNTLMILKHKLLTTVSDINKELKLREESISRV